MIRINDSKSKATLKAAVLVSALLVFAAATGFGQQVVNLTAGPATTTLPDGTTLPMWGYTCGTAATGSTATCAPLSGSSSGATTGALGGIYVLNGGSNYSSSPTVTITPAAGNTPTTAAVATPIVSGGVVVGFNVTKHGAGYTAAPTVTITDTTGTGAAAAAASAWSPVVITVPFVPNGASLTINLTNNLSFTPAGGGSANNIPTSIVIVGQVGGGLGSLSQRTTTQSPSHADAQGCPSWFIASNAPGVPCTSQQTNPPAIPPAQGPRVRSMATEVAAVAPGTSSSTSLTWSSLKPGTYLLESGTHPSIQVPMGLIGMLVVTTAPSGTTAGTAYPAVAANTTNAAVQAAVPAVQYSAEVPLEFSEIDPVQNKVVDLAVRTAGFSETAVWSGMNPNGVLPGLTLTNPGALYTTAPSVTIGGGGGSGATAVATIVPGSGGQISLTLTNGGTGYTSAPTVLIGAPPSGGTQATATAVFSPIGCAATHTCYPPAVNYTPFYYLINGLAFDKTNAGNSLFAATAGLNTATVPPSPIIATGVTGNLLVRLVNAGVRMHVPSIVGSQTTGFTGAGVLTTATNPVSGFTLIAEDGNPLPNLGAPRVQTDVFMAAGKTYDVMVNVPAATTPGGTPPSLPIYDRELSLSANSSVRDAGMLAYIGVNGAVLPVAAGTGVFAGALANPDTYSSVIPCASSATSCTPLVVTDPSKGVIANDVNVSGVELSSAPTNGTLTCNAVPGSPVAGICANGTFTYTPNAGAGSTVTAGSPFDTFGYCANGAAAGTTNLCTTVTLSVSSLSGNPVANAITYNSKMATFLKIPSPGVLSVDSDPNGLPLRVVVSSVTPSGVTINMSPNGGFTATAPGAGTYTFTYIAQNSQGKQSSAATVTLVFPTPSNLQVNVVDAQAYNNCNGDSNCIKALTPIGDYRWIIEEDKTFWVDPNCTTNNSITTPGCPSIVGPSGQSTVPTFGVNFHTSTMDFVAQGCTGPLSCEGGQTMLDNRPACTAPGVPAGCSATAGLHIPAVCDVGNGACRPDTTGSGFTAVLPGQVVLDPAKRYYISVLPGDAANPFPAYVGQPTCDTTMGGISTTGTCGHTMSGAPIPPACNILGGPNACTSTSAFTQPVNVLVLPTPLPTGKLSVIVFEDDFPLNGEQDGGGGNGTIAPIEPGLGSFNIVLWDTYGGLGDVTGQDTNDMFNQPLSNSLAGTIDPVTGLDACPISANATSGPAGAGPAPAGGITGMIVTCPKYEADGTTLSPLAGQAVIANLMPEKFSVQAYPGADRIARGEEWIQTNTLDGQHPHDSFIRIGEPSYFQEYGPAGYHVSIGFANPAIINARHQDICNGNGTPGAVGPCTNTIDGQVDVQRLSRTPDQRLYASGSRDALTWTQCWVSLGDPDGEDFMFTKCDANGNFRFANVPGGNWRLTIGDQWNDQIIDGLSTPANVGCVPTPPATTCTGGLSALHMGNIGVQQWQSNLYTRVFIDDNKNGIFDSNEIGIPLIYTMIHYRDGHNSNSLVSDFNGIANFNETFPLFNWYVVEADSTRYKTTGIHTVYDAGGPADGSTSCGTAANGARQCGTSGAYKYLANTFEAVPLPADLSVPGAVYCKTADCAAEAASFAAGTAIPSSATASTGRIDPPWVTSEGWSGMTSQGNWIEFGKAPYAACDNPTQPASTTNFCATVTVPPPPGSPAGTQPTTKEVGENGGIHGIVNYASTRPFDSASQMIQQPWEPNVPNVTINLYQEGFAADGVTPTLTMVDRTKTSSWDAWAQGFYPNYTDAATGTLLPYMNCPGQGTNTGANQDLFYFTLYDQPNYLDWYSGIHSTPQTAPHALPYNSQYKCYDAMHIWNQVQPAPYDGEYSFPSVLGINAATGKLVSTVGSTNGVTASMAGTNCTICVPNPDSTDVYRFGTPMLPPGKYVLEVIMPQGYEVYKEEDKNLLIGDNYIAPVTQQFAGLGSDIFIIPDQASVASMYDPNADGYNPNNFQNQTTDLSLQEGLSGVPGFPTFQDPVWPCVGEMRVVPDYLSLFPQAKEVAPFAGAVRPLCDRKEVTLANQMSVRAKFSIFTSTHIASKFTGVITDDFTSEFDPFAPQFGEKFAPPNMPISTRDYLGNEISRVYSDHWGIYDGLTFSSWEVNPPNITGYSPSMMVQCMNDPGPITATNGQLINDPLYNPAYSNFCYEEPYMPGLTAYLDTPVIPTQGFVGAGYNNPDCSYPDATPAIKEVDGDGIGPWVSKPGVTLTITALGDQQVNNSAYSGPSASAAPFNMKTLTRHYGFGSQCLSPTAGNATCNTLSSVTIGGRPAVIDSWSDTSIQVTVPTGVPNCAIQQQAQYQGTLPAGQSGTAQCGQLVITAGNGQQSVDTVTVTIGGKTPTHVNASSTIQSAIDAALPGDLIIVDPTCTPTGTPPSTTCNIAALHAATPTQTASAGAHTEMLIMWKPVRLQGVGAASSIINANAHPSGKLLDPWRRHVNCLFGLTLQGAVPTSTSGAGSYDPTGTYNCPDAGWNPKSWSGLPNVPQIDRLPLEATVGWDATLNGNLAEQLQEPSLMGAYEGGGITVLAKGVDFHGANPWDLTLLGGFPTSTTLLTGVGSDPTKLPVGDNNPLCKDGAGGANRFPSNFTCNPSSIDGLSVVNSSQGGGGIFAHGWAHHLQIANNRVYNNAGTLSGGISVGQGEFAPPYVQGGTTNAPPGSCSDGTGFQTNQHLPNCFQLEVNVHNNYITNNSSLGDELFSATLAGGGGTTFCTGNDYYLFNYNWVCGNLSSGEGGGLVHLGEIQNGDIEHNSIVFNQSDNPTIPTNGGGIQIMGTPDTDPVCGTQIDADCPPGLSDGVGHNLTINANLIQGNMAESGSGGGIRLQQVNGTDVSTFATQPNLWNNVSITNNIIVNNLAGWDGAGISLQDSLNVNIINNTIASNDSLASSGVLTQSIGAPLASAPPGNCFQTGPSGPATASCPQSAGVTSTLNSSLLTTTFTGLTITCPPGQPSCTAFSNPLLQNNVIWQNRSFIIGVGSLGSGSLNQQNIVSLFNAFSGTAAPVQTTSGGCTAGVSYWDIGVRGDTGPSNHSSGFTLNPTYSVLDDPADYSTGSNVGVNPNIVSQYCNGSRVPPECTTADGCGGPSGYGVPPGIVDASAPNPVFSLTPSATVDEGNNWINVSWGPLALSNDSVTGGVNSNYGGGSPFGNYTLAAGSPAIDYVPLNSTNLPTATIPALTTDFFGNPRPDPANPNHFDVGAVEFQGGNGLAALTSITPSSGAQGTVVPVTITGTGLTLASAVNVSGTGITVSNFAAVNATTVTATFTIDLATTISPRNVTVTTPAGTSNAITFTVTAPPAPTLASIAPVSGLRGTSTNVTLTGTNLTGGAVSIAAPANGVSVGAVTVVNATTITATITSTLTAALGPRNLSVVTPGGTSNTVAFTVTGPVLTSIAPTSGNRGSVVNVTLTGTGLTGVTAVTVSGADVAVSSVAPSTTSPDTTVTAVFTIAPRAALGARSVTLTTDGGTSNVVAFTVTAPAPSLLSIAPNTGARGTSETVTLTGAPGSMGGATAVNVPGGGVTVTGITVDPTNTVVTATFTITAGAALTARNVTVTTPVTTSNPVAFTIVSPGTPILSAITPNFGLRGTSTSVVLTGANFTAAGTTVTVGAPANGVTVTGVAYVSPTQINATITSNPGAVLGARNIIVHTPGGTSGAVQFAVTGPVLSSIIPVSGYRGRTVPVTLVGTGLTGTTAVNVPGGGVTVSGITVTPGTGGSPDTVTATFTIANGAGATPRSVTVTTPTGGGTSNAVTFTVVTPPAASLTSIAPPTGIRGTTVPVTLTGTDFIGVTGINVPGGGITVSGLNVVSPDTINATFTISTTAADTAPRAVSVTTVGGTSNTVPFTVQGPTLTSISPNTGLRGTAVLPVMFAGSNLNGTTGLTGLGTGVTLVAGTLNVVNDTTVTASLAISTTATVGIHNIGLTTPIGTTNTIPFTVTGATLATISPTSATHPATGTISVPVTITGTNLTGTTALTGLGTGVTVAAGSLTSTSTTITATLTVSNTATTGARAIGATTAAGATTNTVTFTVN